MKGNSQSEEIDKLASELDWLNLHCSNHFHVDSVIFRVGPFQQSMGLGV